MPEAKTLHPYLCERSGRATLVVSPISLQNGILHMELPLNAMIHDFTELDGMMSEDLAHELALVTLLPCSLGNVPKSHLLGILLCGHVFGTSPVERVRFALRCSHVRGPDRLNK
jgi:hypothetical protein